VVGFGVSGGVVALDPSYFVLETVLCCKYFD
jgi:hypothetical protein